MFVHNFSGAFQFNNILICVFGVTGSLFKKEKKIVW